jgi:hypothetical protein
MSIQHSAIKQVQLLVQSELSDFFSGLEQPGEPTNAKEMNAALQSCINNIFEDAETKWFSNPSKNLVWMTREEFNHYTAIQKMKPVSLDFIREFALREMQRSKAAMNSSFYIGDEDDGHFFKVDALEWGLLARGLQREITKLGGL